MRNLASILALVLATLLQSLSAQDNVLSTPAVSAQRGQTIPLPFLLDNASDITALQFTLELPDGFFLVEGSARLNATRKGDHVLTATPMTGGNRYNILSYSPTNQPYKGHSGELLTLSLKAANSLGDGEEYYPVIQDLVLTLPSGANAATGYHCGAITLSQYPDLVVEDVQVEGRQFSPEDAMTVSFLVRNQGTGPLAAGWREVVRLVGDDASGQRVASLVATSQMNLGNEELLPGATMSRQIQLTLPQAVGVDGNVSVEVELIPYANAGESETAQSNNVQRSGETVELRRFLYWSLSRQRLHEGLSDNSLRAQLVRSGYSSQSQSFQLTGTSDSRIALPGEITIPAGQSSAVLNLTVVNDQTLNADTLYLLSASGAGYDAAECQFVIVDDEYPSLMLSASDTLLHEGDTLVMTLSTDRAPASDQVVNVRCDVDQRFHFPARVTLPAGQDQVSFTISVIDDDIPSLDLQPLFTAQTSGYHTGSCQVTLLDDDMPDIEMTLTPHTLGEDAGLMVIRGHLKRLTNTGNRVTIVLSDDSKGDIYYHTQRLELGRGVTDLDFLLGVIDNQQVDGERDVTVRASVYMSACSCSATGTNAGEVSQTLHILDNDGPALQLTSSRSMLLEGSSEGTTLTISRNTDTADELKVYLHSDYDEGVTYPEWVIIEAGQRSAQAVVHALANDSQDDDRTVIFTAEAADYNAGVCWLMLTDQTLPDAVLTQVTLSADTLVSGDRLTVGVTVGNQGVGVLPAQTLVTVSVDGELYARLYTQQPLAPGSQETLSGHLQRQPSVGRHALSMTVNEGKEVRELLYNNNVSEERTFYVNAPFQLSLTTDKAVYKTGEPIVCRGQATGQYEPGQEIEIYVIDDYGRHTLSDSLNVDGSYEAVYTPYEKQAGHLALGVCYPGEASELPMAEVDVYGLRRATLDYLTAKMLVGETYPMTIGVVNPGTLGLNDIKATVVSKPAHYEVQCTPLASLAGGSQGDIQLQLKASATTEGHDWEHIIVRLESREGASLLVTLYCYASYPMARLVPSITRIDATMTKGKTRQYPFYFVNQGQGESGPVSLVLPAWMKASVPTQLPSLASGDTVHVVLMMTPTDDMQLNVARTGSIGVNCDNGDGFPLPFSVIPVSEEKGTLEVDVCDEYTYYTAEAPHVSGAQVTIQHPATGAVVAEGVTGADGIYRVELPEGYYRVCISEEHHETYQNYHVINAGQTEHVTVNVSYHAVTVTWDVVETEVEDEYSIVSTFTFEAHVPAPVVKMTLPEKIDGDNMAVGETRLIYMTLTNLGLIRADENEIILPDGDGEWEFEALDHTEPFSIEPQQTVMVPILITRISDGVTSKPGRFLSKPANAADEARGCMVGMRDRYKWLCGDDLKNNEAAERMAMKLCAAALTMSQIMNIITGGSGPGGPGGGGGGKYGGGDGSGMLSTDSRGICDTCMAKKYADLIDELIGFTPLGDINEGMNTAYDAAKLEQYRQSGYIIKEVIVNAADNLAGELCPPYDAAKKIYKIYKLVEPCKPDPGNDSTGMLDPRASAGVSPALPRPQRVSDTGYGWMDEFNAVAYEYLDYYAQADSMLALIFGDKRWFYEWDDEKASFLTYVGTLADGYMPSDEELLAVKPASVTIEQMKALIQHVNVDDPEPYVNGLNTVCDSIGTFLSLAHQKGCEDMWDYFSEALDTYQGHFEEEQSSVCSSITLQFSQHMTMTRQAFRGTLSVYNGHATTALQNARLELIVKDADGNEATSHEFQINLEKLQGFTGTASLDGEWSLGADETGVATILFIPTRYAAPDHPVYWSFGGRLTYLDPYTNLEVTRTLAPIPLEVRPSPVLNLTYFMQRDVYADDPLTEEVEQGEEAEFALLINNIGNGDATNVNMVTDQPQIIDNEKGLLIDFEIISAQVNGQDKALALGESVATAFGTIPSQQTLYAQWWFTSSLLGHFRTYDVKATHVTSYGNEDLSLLDEVTIHEMIHGLDVPQADGSSLYAWLVNDVADAEDQPDAVYLSDGGVEPLQLFASASLQRISDLEYWLTVTPDGSGWNYGSLPDPTAGMQKVVSVTRMSDSKPLGSRGVWQTWCRMPDGKNPVHEYTLHFADDLPASTAETYRLIFEPRPDVMLEVEAFEGVEPEVTVYTDAVTEMTVVFNKAIDPQSFTAADVSLRCQGEQLALDGMDITQVTDRSYRLTLSDYTSRSGYYVLTVGTSGITDIEGFAGKRDANVSWIQQVSSGIIQLNEDLTAAEGFVYNAQGGLVRKCSPSAFSSDALVGLPDGIYVLVFEYGGVRHERKLLKQGH